MRRGTSIAIALALVDVSCERAASHERRQLPRLPTGALGGDFCVVLDDGRVTCTGALAVPEQSMGEPQELRAIPLPESALQVTVLPRSEAACAVSTRGAVWCWGLLGTATVEPPTRVEDIPTSRLVVGTTSTFCALAVDGTVWCWSSGDPEHARFEHTLRDASSTPVRIEGIPPAKTIGGGVGAACALVDGGAAWCWGSLDGTSFHSATQVAATGIVRFLETTSYVSPVCVETQDAPVACLDGSGRFHVEER